MMSTLSTSGGRETCLFVCFYPVRGGGGRGERDEEEAGCLFFFPFRSVFVRADSARAARGGGGSQNAHLLDLAVHDGHHALEPVVLDDLARLLGDRRALDADDARGARLCRKQAEDPRAASNVQHRLALEKVAVVEDGVHVGAGAHGVLEHLLVDACFAVWAVLRFC